MKARAIAADRLALLVAALLAGTWMACAEAPAATVPGQMPDVIDATLQDVDLSFLNAAERPAGRHGFVKARGDKLVFDDGSVARFWGTNITAATLFQSDRESVVRHARRLSRLGFNLVRLHHHDSFWSQPNIFGMNAASTHEPDPAMLDKIDWWVKCLKDEGIYIWIDLHVQRALTRADGVEHFDEVLKDDAAAELKGFSHVNPSIEQAMQHFNEAYLGHVNPYTRRALKDEPAVAAMLITNENDVTQHHANALLPNRKVPWHTARYMGEARRFARANSLDEDKTWRSWEYGPSRLFLNDLEHAFGVRMVSHLRAFGVKVPIATTSLWGGQPVSLPALSAGDIVDVHAYEKPGFLGHDPSKEASQLGMAAAAQLSGMPTTLSEWGMDSLKSPDRHVLPLVVSAFASHQGWDAALHYAYAQSALQSPGAPSPWHAYNDPSRLAILPAAALMYRLQHVREGAATTVFAPSANELFMSPTPPAVMRAIGQAAEQGRVVMVLPAVPSLPWLKPSPATSQATPMAEASTAAEYVASKTGEIARRWKRGIFTVDSPRTQAIAGRCAGEPVALSHTRFKLLSATASAAVQSLDDQPIASSNHLLVSLATDSSPQRPDQLPFMAAPVHGEVEIEAQPGLSLAPAPGVELRAGKGRYLLRIDSPAPIHWLHLIRRH